MDERQQKKWNAPVYTNSSRVSINHKIAENNHCLINKRESFEMDCIRILRTKLLLLTREHNWRTIMVTSICPGEGKTVTAINLAFSMACEHEQTVTLVEADFRMPSICKYLGIKSTLGLTDYFDRNISIQDIILWPEVDKLTIIPAGKTLCESAEIVGSPKMAQLVNEMKSRYNDRYIIFDLPPLLSIADPLAFIPFVDCILLVIEAGKTPITEIKKALSHIPKDKLLGLVLNKCDEQQVEYYRY